MRDRDAREDPSAPQLGPDDFQPDQTLETDALAQETVRDRGQEIRDRVQATVRDRTNEKAFGLEKLEKAPSSSRASVPPSEPRGSRSSLSSIEAAVDRPARLQMIVALMLGLVLVAIPLYLWRRPRAESISTAHSGADAGGAPMLPMMPTTAAESEPKPTLSDARVLQCQDPGSKKTSPEQCDHVPELEKAFAKAIEESASCVPKDAGGGTIQYVADVSFKKKAVVVTTPKEARSMKNVKVAAACATTVKAKLHTLALDGLTHQHARYKIAITATYPGPVKP